MADKNQSNLYEQSSYNQVPEAGNPTYSEAWALVEAARRMAEPLEFGSLEDPENLGKLRDGLRLNWRLWTIFQTELSLEEGPVPEELRGNMLSLCNFVDKHTVQTLNEPTAEQSRECSANKCVCAVSRENVCRFEKEQRRKQDRSIDDKRRRCTEGIRT